MENKTLPSTDGKGIRFPILIPAVGRRARVSLTLPENVERSWKVGLYYLREFKV
jgi:hypothetical protein